MNRNYIYKKVYNAPEKLIGLKCVIKCFIRAFRKLAKHKNWCYIWGQAALFILGFAYLNYRTQLLKSVFHPKSPFTL